MFEEITKIIFSYTGLPQVKILQKVFLGGTFLTHTVYGSFVILKVIFVFLDTVLDMKSLGRIQYCTVLCICFLCKHTRFC